MQHNDGKLLNFANSWKVFQIISGYENERFSSIKFYSHFLWGKSFLDCNHPLFLLLSLRYYAFNSESVVDVVNIFAKKKCKRDILNTGLSSRNEQILFLHFMLNFILPKSNDCFSSNLILKVNAWLYYCRLSKQNK